MKGFPLEFGPAGLFRSRGDTEEEPGAAALAGHCLDQGQCLAEEPLSEPVSKRGNDPAPRVNVRDAARC
jgi:hypothetical protein